MTGKQLVSEQQKPYLEIGRLWLKVHAAWKPWSEKLVGMNPNIV